MVPASPGKLCKNDFLLEHFFETTVGGMPVLAFKDEGKGRKCRRETNRKPMQGSMAKNFSSFGIALEKRAGGTIP